MGGLSNEEDFLIEHISDLDMRCIIMYYQSSQHRQAKPEGGIRPSMG
jgi:hypothetical protein